LNAILAYQGKGVSSSPTRHVARALNAIPVYQGKGVSSAPPDTWQCPRARVSRLARPRLFKEGPHHHLKVRVTSTKWELRLHFNIHVSPIWKREKVAFILQMRSAFLRQHDPYVYKTCVQSLHLQSVQQYTGTSRWLFYPKFNSTLTTSSEHRGGPDCISKYSQWSFLVALTSLIVHSQRPKSRLDQVQDISEDC